MRVLNATLTSILLLALGLTTATAQMATDLEGGNAFVQKVLSQVELPDGSTLLNVKSTGFTWTMSDDAPIGNGSIVCYGNTLVSSEMGPTYGAGMCQVLDDDGDLWTIWYTGTDGGEWGITGGTGKYAGATGNGTWANTTAYADSKQMNSWKGSITMP